MFTDMELDRLAALLDRVERGDYAEDRGLPPRRVPLLTVLGYALAWLMISLAVSAVLAAGALVVLLMLPLP